MSTVTCSPKLLKGQRHQLSCSGWTRLTPGLSRQSAQIPDDLYMDEDTTGKMYKSFVNAWGLSELTPKVQRQQCTSTRRPALSLSKMKAAYYPDVGLEQLVPDQFWIAEECKYDIAAMYGISHWWVQRQRFLLTILIEETAEQDRYGVQMIMRFNEIHKFSDGTLQQIDEALDYRVKEFQINRTNPGMNTRFWTKKDVDRSKDFMFAIQKRLKT
ncbi:hypothetical protein Tco_1234689 [Tanacetum coccineum]